MSDKNKKRSKLAGYAGDSGELSREEIKVFIHNAQVVLANLVAEDRIVAVTALKNYLVGVLEPGRKFSADEWACVLVSAAWDVFEKGK